MILGILQMGLGWRWGLICGFTSSANLTHSCHGRQWGKWQRSWCPSRPQVLIMQYDFTSIGYRDLVKHKVSVGYELKPQNSTCLFDHSPLVWNHPEHLDNGFPFTSFPFHWIIFIIYYKPLFLNPIASPTLTMGLCVGPGDPVENFRPSEAISTLFLWSDWRFRLSSTPEQPAAIGVGV